MQWNARAHELKTHTPAGLDQPHENGLYCACALHTASQRNTGVALNPSSGLAGRGFVARVRASAGPSETNFAPRTLGAARSWESSFHRTSQALGDVYLKSSSFLHLRPAGCHYVD